MQYVSQGLQRREVLDIVTRDYPYYLWSLRTLRYFYIYYTTTDVTVSHVRKVIGEDQVKSNIFHDQTSKR